MTEEQIIHFSQKNILEIDIFQTKYAGKDGRKKWQKFLADLLKIFLEKPEENLIGLFTQDLSKNTALLDFDEKPIKRTGFFQDTKYQYLCLEPSKIIPQIRNILDDSAFFDISSFVITKLPTHIKKSELKKNQEEIDSIAHTLLSSNYNRTNYPQEYIYMQDGRSFNWINHKTSDIPKIKSAYSNFINLK